MERYAIEAPGAIEDVAAPGRQRGWLFELLILPWRRRFSPHCSRSRYYYRHAPFSPPKYMRHTHTQEYLTELSQFPTISFELPNFI
jgi:hypothetical protein